MREIPEWEQWKNRIIFIKERAFLLPENCPDFKGLRVVRSGLYLGDCLKKRFEPSQAGCNGTKPEEYKRSVSFKAEDICCGKVSPRGDSRYRRCRTEWMDTFLCR